MAYKYTLIGNFLKKRRLTEGLSQRDVGLKLGYGSAQFISNIERGEASIPPKVIKKLMNVLSISEKEVLKIMLQQHEQYLRSQIGIRRA